MMTAFTNHLEVRVINSPKPATTSAAQTENERCRGRCTGFRWPIKKCLRLLGLTIPACIQGFTRQFLYESKCSPFIRARHTGDNRQIPSHLRPPDSAPAPYGRTMPSAHEKRCCAAEKSTAAAMANMCPTPRREKSSCHVVWCSAPGMMSSDAPEPVCAFQDFEATRPPPGKHRTKLNMWKTFDEEIKQSIELTGLLRTAFMPCQAHDSCPISHNQPDASENHKKRS